MCVCVTEEAHSRCLNVEIGENYEASKSSQMKVIPRISEKANSVGQIFGTQFQRIFASTQKGTIKRNEKIVGAPSQSFGHPKGNSDGYHVDSTAISPRDRKTIAIFIVCLLYFSQLQRA